MGWHVCPRCHGEGHYVNPDIDGNGLTSDDIERLGGEDFIEDYQQGVYDVPCELCGTRTTVTFEQLADWRDGEQARAERRTEARMLGEY